jgi:hypothetical protein
LQEEDSAVKIEVLPVEAAAMVEAVTRVIEGATKVIEAVNRVIEAATEVLEAATEVVNRIEEVAAEVSIKRLADFTLKEPAIRVTSANFFIFKIMMREEMEDIKVMDRDMKVPVTMLRIKTDKYKLKVLNLRIMDQQISKMVGINKTYKWGTAISNSKCPISNSI